MKFFLISLGCPKNLTNSEEFSARLLAHGHQLVFTPQEADTVIINTCGFISSAVKEGTEEIRHALELKRQGVIKRVAVTGCMVDRYREQMAKDFPEADTVFSIAAQDHVEDLIGQDGLFLESLANALYIPEYKMTLTATHTAYLKIADGCNYRCAYCTIPFIRGAYRSKPMEQIVQEARLLTQNGVKEISLIAQDTTSYGIDLYKKPSLTDLLKKLLKIRGLGRLRIMYAYPNLVTQELADLMAGEEQIFHYLDIPLQHIADPVLKNMNRQCDGKKIKDTLDMLKKTVPDISLRTNFIVGFPQETQKDFNELKKFVREYEFDNMGVFEYFREKGTPAYEMKQIPAAVKHQRARELEETQSRVIDKINKRLVGAEMEVIADGADFGRTYKDAPDIDGKVTFTKPVPPGCIFYGRVVAAQGYEREIEPLKIIKK
ncbi:MAG: 30S ribosomal protein S12 methylthiotransferase RimO [Spirochaetota bacterium]|uniref:30S ribosomal protein S12 methylthiotransferase RimO n=1 Tax=Candidatus Avelusimicrobium faecicola TaxID=3416205 RepID=UPI002A5CB4FC|nr:30S ribosomal protein S12 methylthiotransferase RimO [Spirochaetota bacterium]MDE3277020.1 30S ribosomal protein S12 methylthiotransferase RimO [Spirochaetota bacterium]MDY2940616.1 30S ribosomal protein S12 methylthiotransferase RimO [Elusimicrobiaceae bacterium]MDY6129172.1 30S ribosomal protein S12 methylthiotransferase RimO [Elusimicrobiaceae bacterium]